MLHSLLYELLLVFPKANILSAFLVSVRMCHGSKDDLKCFDSELSLTADYICRLLINLKKMCF